MVLSINCAYQSNKKNTIIEVYHTIGACNNNAYNLKIIIQPQIYEVEHVYLSDLNFYLDITDLYMRFNIDFDFPKTKEYICHRFYFIYSLFPLYIFYYYIGSQLYLLVLTAPDNHINWSVRKQ